MDIIVTFVAFNIVLLSCHAGSTIPCFMTRVVALIMFHVAVKQWSEWIVTCSRSMRIFILVWDFISQIISFIGSAVDYFMPKIVAREIVSKKDMLIPFGRVLLEVVFLLYSFPFEGREDFYWIESIFILFSSFLKDPWMETAWPFGFLSIFMYYRIWAFVSFLLIKSEPCLIAWWSLTVNNVIKDFWIFFKAWLDSAFIKFPFKKYNFTLSFL